MRRKKMDGIELSEDEKNDIKYWAEKHRAGEVGALGSLIWKVEILLLMAYQIGQSFKGDKGEK